MVCLILINSPHLLVLFCLLLHTPVAHHLCPCVTGNKKTPQIRPDSCLQVKDWTPNTYISQRKAQNQLALRMTMLSSAFCLNAFVRLINSLRCCQTCVTDRVCVCSN